MTTSWMLRALLGVASVRRRMRGPLREAWPIEHEAWTRVLHHYAKRSHLLPLGVQRRTLELAVRRAARPVAMEPVDAHGVPAAWFSPEDADPERLLVYLHGGGYSIGSVASHAEFIGRLAREAGTRAFAIDYRLAPEHPFPAQLEDSRRAWEWLLERGVDPARTVLAGESAGGGLTMSTLLALREAGDPLPAAAAILSPWLDLTLQGRSIDANARYDYLHRHVLEAYAARVAGLTDRRDPLLSPIFGDLRGLPPLLIQVGGAEALLDDSLRIAERAAEAGVEVEIAVFEDMVHAFQLFAGVPAARRALRQLCDFVHRHVGAAPSPQIAPDPEAGVG